jgi:hypothetical protein
LSLLVRPRIFADKLIDLARETDLAERYRLPLFMPVVGGSSAGRMPARTNRPHRLDRFPPVRPITATPAYACRFLSKIAEAAKEEEARRLAASKAHRPAVVIVRPESPEVAKLNATSAVLAAGLRPPRPWANSLISAGLQPMWYRRAEH